MSGVVVYWPLTQGKVAVVDLESVERLRGHKWFAMKRPRGIWYAGTNVQTPRGSRIMCMHTFLAGYPRVDHWDGDGLNNRVSNLRSADASQNAANQKKQLGRSSRFKGVTWDKDQGNWRALICKNQKSFYLGNFGDEEEAARAYDAAAHKYFGEFARPNFPVTKEHHLG